MSVFLCVSCVLFGVCFVVIVLCVFACLCVRLRVLCVFVLCNVSLVRVFA